MRFNLKTITFMLSGMALTHAKLAMIIRHGEKLNDETTDLSPKGQTRAYCLVNAFGNNGTYAVPQKIFAQSPTEKKQSTRPRDTVTPLAEALGLTVDLSYTSGQIKKLTKSILNSNDEVTLVSWSNDNIPEIAEKFGITNPPDWDGDVFDEIWMIYDSATTTYYNANSAVTKRDSYAGTDGYTMEIVKQDIEECIAQNLSLFSQSTTSSSSSTNANASSGSNHLTTSLFLTLFGLMTYLIALY